MPQSERFEHPNDLIGFRLPKRHARTDRLQSIELGSRARTGWVVFVQPNRRRALLRAAAWE